MKILVKINRNLSKFPFELTRTRIETTPSNTTTKSRLFDGSQFVNKTWGAVKSAGSTIKSTTQQAASIAANQIRVKRPAKDQRKIEKQIFDEIHKIFDDSDSFYYCPDADFTNNLQQRNNTTYDDRFFWNKHMLKDILELNVSDRFIFLSFSSINLCKLCIVFRTTHGFFQWFKALYSWNSV